MSGRPRKKRSRLVVDEGESVTDPESSKSKVISSVSLFLRLLSPFYGSPRSFFLPDRDSGQVHCLLDSVFLSFSFHFLPSRHPALRSFALPHSLSLSLFRGACIYTHDARSQLSRHLCKRHYTIAAISFVRRDSCRRTRSRRVIMSVSMAPIRERKTDS